MFIQGKYKTNKNFETYLFITFTEDYSINAQWSCQLHIEIFFYINNAIVIRKSNIKKNLR